jgi:hypothetical protein
MAEEKKETGARDHPAHLFRRFSVEVAHEIALCEGTLNRGGQKAGGEAAATIGHGREHPTDLCDSCVDRVG